METQKPLLKDEDGDEVDVHLYRSMIGSLMYLTSLRPDIMFAVCACARYQVKPKVSHLHAVKRIFSDYAVASLDRKSTIGDLLTKAFDQFWTTAKDKTINGEAQLHAWVDGKKIIITEASVRRDLQLADENVYVVPTGRVIVPAGRYIVPAGKVIIIVSTSRLSLVPTGRVLSPGSDNDSDDASVHSEATIPQQQQNIQPQFITTVSNNNAKFPYLKKDDYERESKARTTLLQSIPNDHVADFHYIDDARDIWNAVKARFGGNAESKKMRKSMLKQEFSEQRPDGMFISQDKYVQEILKKFDMESVRTATTPYEAPKPKSKNEPDSPVNVHFYRS
ncbi:hypothetical protein Tco_0693374 [Tanacetum coccineum]